MSVYGFSELTCTPLYPKYLGFRHQVFNEILKYNQSGNPVYHLEAFGAGLGIPTHNFPDDHYGVEYDNYDVPKALHIAYAQAYEPPARLLRHKYRIEVDHTRSQILGCLRLLPTDGPYMIRDNVERGVWKNVKLLRDSLPNQHDIYEASRIAVAPHLRADEKIRDTVLDNLVYANVELGVRLGVKKMVGIMYDRVWESVYRKRGVGITYISEPFHVDNGLPVIIGEIDTSEDSLATLSQYCADKIAKKLIVPPNVEVGTWCTHYYHVNQALPGSLKPKENYALPFANAN